MENMNNNNDKFNNQQPNGGFESTLENKSKNADVAKGCFLGATIMLLIMLIIGIVAFFFIFIYNK